MATGVKLRYSGAGPTSSRPAQPQERLTSQTPNPQPGFARMEPGAEAPAYFSSLRTPKARTACLGKLSPDKPGSIAVLALALADQERSVRTKAIGALPKFLGDSSASSFYALLESQNPLIRAGAAKALALMLPAPDRPLFVPDMALATKGMGRAHTELIAEVLRGMGPAASKCLLAEIGNGARPLDKVTYLKVLSVMDAEAAIPSALRLLQEGTGLERVAAARYLKTRPDPKLSRLASILIYDPNPEIRSWAIANSFARGTLTLKVNEVMHAVRNFDSRVMVTAAEALSVERNTGLLLKMLSSPVEAIPEWGTALAVRTLTHMRESAAAEWFDAVIEDKSLRGRTRIAAAVGLRKTAKGEINLHLAALIYGLNSADPKLSSSCARTLSSKENIDYLVSYLPQSEGKARERILGIFERNGGQWAEALAGLISQGDAALSAEACRCIGRMGARGVRALPALFDRMRDESASPVLKAALLEAIVAIEADYYSGRKTYGVKALAGMLRNSQNSDLRAFAEHALRLIGERSKMAQRVLAEHASN